MRSRNEQIYSIIQENKRLPQFENDSNYEFIETETKFKLEKSA